jgi:hypothetical protein
MPACMPNFGFFAISAYENLAPNSSPVESIPSGSVSVCPFSLTMTSLLLAIVGLSGGDLSEVTDPSEPTRVLLERIEAVDCTRVLALLNDSLVRAGLISGVEKEKDGGLGIRLGVRVPLFEKFRGKYPPRPLPLLPFLAA